MSVDDTSGIAGSAGSADDIFGGLDPASEADEVSTKSPVQDESRYSGLRNLAQQKKTWSIWLRWILAISFGLQVALLVAVFFGREVDVWTVRGVLLQFTAMFIAALRYLFK